MEARSDSSDAIERARPEVVKYLKKIYVLSNRLRSNLWRNEEYHYQFYEDLDVPIVIDLMTQLEGLYEITKKVIGNEKLRGYGYYDVVNSLDYLKNPSSMFGTKKMKAKKKHDVGLKCVKTLLIANGYLRNDFHIAAEEVEEPKKIQNYSPPDNSISNFQKEDQVSVDRTFALELSNELFSVLGISDSIEASVLKDTWEKSKDKIFKSDIEDQEVFVDFNKRINKLNTKYKIPKNDTLLLDADEIARKLHAYYIKSK